MQIYSCNQPYGLLIMSPFHFISLFLPFSLQPSIIYLQVKAAMSTAIFFDLLIICFRASSNILLNAILVKWALITLLAFEHKRLLYFLKINFRKCIPLIFFSFAFILNFKKCIYALLNTHFTIRYFYIRDLFYQQFVLFLFLSLSLIISLIFPFL